MSQLRPNTTSPKVKSSTVQHLAMQQYTGLHPALPHTTTTAPPTLNVATQHTALQQLHTSWVSWGRPRLVVVLLARGPVLLLYSTTCHHVQDVTQEGGIEGRTAVPKQCRAVCKERPSCRCGQVCIVCCSNDNCVHQSGPLQGAVWLVMLHTSSGAVQGILGWQ